MPNHHEEASSELFVRKSLGILDAVSQSIGFTTTNLQHFIIPIEQGGIGIPLVSEEALMASLIATGVSTVVISGFFIYYVIQLINQYAEEIHELIKKQNAFAEKEIIFFAKLSYLRHLFNKPLNDALKTHIGLNQDAANELANIVEEIYQEEKGFSQIIRQRNVHEESEEKAIQRYMFENKETYLPRIQQGLNPIYASHPAIKKNWHPELIGIFTGFISFMGMSSGFIGAYYGVVSLIIGMGTVSLTIPVIGWVAFAASLLFGLAVGLIVRHYTCKTVQREEARHVIQIKEATLHENSEKIHELEMRLLNERAASQSWFGRFFDCVRHNIPQGFYQPSKVLKAS